MYLHYVVDRWVRQWRRVQAHGDVVVVGFADDLVVGFEHEDDAERFLADLRGRFAKFGLELHPEKTRPIEFRRHAARNRAAKGLGKPGHLRLPRPHAHLREGRNRGFWVERITVSKRMRAKPKALSAEIKRRRHEPVPVQGGWLGSVVRGHVASYAVPGNSKDVREFRTLGSVRGATRKGGPCRNDLPCCSMLYTIWPGGQWQQLPRRQS